VTYVFTFFNVSSNLQPHTLSVQYPFWTSYPHSILNILFSPCQYWNHHSPMSYGYVIIDVTTVPMVINMITPHTPLGSEKSAHHIHRAHHDGIHSELWNGPAVLLPQQLLSNPTTSIHIWSIHSPWLVCKPLLFPSCFHKILLERYCLSLNCPVLIISFISTPTAFLISRLMHHARKKMKVLMNNNCEL
jgi:hypothetical protein